MASNEKGAGASWEVVFSSVKLGVGRGIVEMGETEGEGVEVVDGVEGMEGCGEGVSVEGMAGRGREGVGSSGGGSELRLNMPNEVSLKEVSDGGATSLVPWFTSGSGTRAGSNWGRRISRASEEAASDSRGTWTMEFHANSVSFEDSVEDSLGESGFEDSGADSFESFAESSSFDSLFESVAASLFEVLVQTVSKSPDNR